LLCDELVGRGHDVTLFAVAGSHTRARLVATVDTPPHPDDPEAVLTEAVHTLGPFLRSGEFDVIHDHTRLGPGLAAMLRHGPPGIRIEDFVEDNRYQVHAEIPGIDPEKDVEITVSDGVLVIKAERSEEKKDKHRSEFRYGSLVRTIRLPMAADEGKVTASYSDGILTVTIPLTEVKKPARQVSIERTN